MTPMANAEHSSIQTRPSLLNRLSTGDDAEGWQEFYRVYGKLVRDFAIKAGLSDTEADEVALERWNWRFLTNFRENVCSS
jgi:hypothetical protein